MKTPTARLVLAAALGLCLVLPGTASALVTEYTDPADFNAATASATSYTFPAPQGDGSDEGTSFTSGPLTFSGYRIELYNDGGYGDGVSYVSELISPETITLSGATAVSFTIGTFEGPQTVAISVNGVPFTSVTEAGPHPDTLFVGFTDTVPITSLTFSDITNPSNEIDVINFQVGSAAPEPSTWALLGAGLAGLLGLRLRRRATRM